VSLRPVTTLISVTDFRHLLLEIKNIRPDVCIRYRMLGEMWVINFLSVFYVTDKTVVLNDEVNRKMIAITDLSNIMQFEIDKPFNGFQPYFHYEVQPLLDHVDFHKS
jgi:hypothetical protein